MRTDVGNITQTDFGYTGQRALGMGLLDYKARFYDAYLNRWTQPDSSILPYYKTLNVWSELLASAVNPDL
jgi:RHS repeat-associated protein